MTHMTMLRRRMIEDMQLAGLAQGTQERYLTAVAALAQAYNRPPDLISEKQIREYVLMLRDVRCVAYGTFQTHWYGIRFFFMQTLGVDWNIFTKNKIGKPKHRRLPVARSDQECRRLILCLAKEQYRLCFSLMYACGLRISEAVTLPIDAIDSAQMLLRIIGKGNKERAVPLPPSLLEPMRRFWRTHRHSTWLFPSRTGLRPMTPKTARRAFRKACVQARLDARFTPHVLRHSYATRLIENGTPLTVVQVLLGHGSIRSTQRYIHLTDPLRRDVQATVEKLFAGLS